CAVSRRIQISRRRKQLRMVRLAEVTWRSPRKAEVILRPGAKPGWNRLSIHKKLFIALPPPRTRRYIQSLVNMLRQADETSLSSGRQKPVIRRTPIAGDISAPVPFRVKAGQTGNRFR